MTVVIVDREATTQVRAGENGGRTLHHVDVVRSVSSTAASTSGAVQVALPPGENHDGEEVIAFVQSAGGAEKGKPVLGVTRAPVPGRS
jgi:hypothetical protein